MFYILVILSVFAAACAQMLLKQGARMYTTWWRQYINVWVIGGYAIMACSLVLNIFCMSRGVQVKEVSVIESLSYLFVPCLAFLIFREKITWRKAGAILIIIGGVILFFL
jgi:drug/metabolite transporter (DMT)-like permease